MISMLKNAVIELGYENKSGSILYSGNETLRKGNFYFLGANPGGHSDQSNSKYPDTILNQVLRKNSYPSFNEYFDGKGKSLCTAKDYRDFEMYVDWKIKEKVLQ